MEPAMTGKKLKKTRSYKSLRFSPPKTIDSRALDFLQHQKPSVNFSASLSVKALNPKTKPSADNKPQRKKASGPVKRYGMAVYDPKGKWTPGKVFVPWIMKHNRASGDDVPNVGWVTPPKTIEPKNVSKTVKALIDSNKLKPGYTFSDSKPNPRTGGFEKKALGPSLGTLVPGGDIGARAASKLGLVVDSLGKLRCPPGVPAANQFTDSTGSNCFDFMPAVAKRLLNEATQFGREKMSHLAMLNNIEQTARRDSGLITPSTSGLILPPAQNLIIPSILGPDGKILSTISTIEPIVYAETVRAQLARDYPNIDMEERERIVKLAEQKAGMIQGVNSKIKTSLDYLKELGIKFDENDPQSLTTGLISAIEKLKENGWDIDYRQLLWGVDLEKNQSLSMEEKVALHTKGVVQTAVEIVLGNPSQHFSDKELDELFADLAGDADEIVKNVSNAVLNNDLSKLSAGQKKVALKVIERMNDYWASEHGFLMSILAEHKENPADVELIQRFGLMDPTDSLNKGTEAMVIPMSDGKLAMLFNPIGMMMDEPPSMPGDGEWRMYKGDGKGLEIEQIQAISRVVDADTRKRLLNEFLKQRNQSPSSQHLNAILEKNAGRLGRSMFIFQHELTHAKQYSLLAYLISHDPSGRRLKGMSNTEILNLVDELIGGRNSLMSLESVLSDPRVMASAFAEMGTMVEAIVKDGMAGGYPQSHLQAMNILAELLALPPSQRLNAAEKLFDERDNLIKAKDANFITPEEDSRLAALNNATNAIAEILENPENMTLESAIREQRALMFAEAIAELNAGVKMGLIQPTDEIKKVLEHINGPMDEVHRFKNSIEEHGKWKSSYMDGSTSYDSKRKKRTKGDITGQSYSERKKRLVDDNDPISAMDSTESFNSKKSLVSRFSKIRERVMQGATEKQKKAFLEELPEQNDGKIINQDGLLIAELADSSNVRDGFGDGKTFDKKLEEDIIPILDLIENSTLEDDVAVVMDIGNLKKNKNPNRVTFMEFVNFVRAGIALNKQKYEIDDFPKQNQKMIVKVPKGSHGIPDFDFAPLRPKPSKPEDTWDTQRQPLKPEVIRGGLTDRELTDADVEELYKRYEENKIKNPKTRRPRSGRETPDKMLEEEERQVERERTLGMASVSKGLRSSSTAAAARSQEIIKRAKTKNIDIDTYERDRMPRVDKFNVNMQDGEFNLGEFKFLVSEEQDAKRTKDIQETILAGGFRPSYDNTKFIKVDDKFILDNWFYGDEKKGFGVKLHIIKLIAIAKGDSKKIEQIDKLIDDVKKMSAEEFNIAVREASLRMKPQFNQMISVEVDDPIKIIQSGKYLTVHDKEKMNLAGARGLSERDNFDIETILRARSNIEQRFFGISPTDTSPETTELRPASGYVSTQNSVKKRVSLLKETYGEDIEIQHPYAIGELAQRSSQDMSRYGDARLILRPEVSERTLVFTGDSIANTGDYSPALKLSTIDDSEYRQMYFDPMSILYADRTGDMDSIASPAENLPKDGAGKNRYQEAMILGSFDAPDVAAIIMTPQEARDSYGVVSRELVRNTADNNITSLIATAQLRENLLDKGIDVVLNSRLFPLDEVEPFNTQMTRKWVQTKIEKGKSDPDDMWNNLKLEQLIPDDETTPYEAYLRAVNATFGEGTKLNENIAIFDHPDNENGNNKKNQINLSNMINSELERLQSTKEKPLLLGQEPLSNSTSAQDSQNPRGEIGSMLLAPGKIEITGEREDGTLVGRLVEQNTPSKSLSRLQSKLQEIVDNPGVHGSHKVEAQRALGVIKARKNAESVTGSRSLSGFNGGAVSQMPSTINQNSRQILERLEDNGATWGESLDDSLAIKNPTQKQPELRTTQEKIDQGPQNFKNGRDKNKTPAMARVDNSERQFGKTAKEINSYFLEKHNVDLDVPNRFLSEQGDEIDRQKAVTYGALQAIDDVFENLNIKSLAGRDNLKISINDFIADANLGQFAIKEKFFSKTTYGDEKTKSMIQINKGGISNMSLQEIWYDIKSNGTQAKQIDMFFAKLGLPNGFDPIFPGEDSPNFENWKSVENEFLQRIAYGVTVHEIGHYLDFTQRDEGNSSSAPPIMRNLFGRGKPSSDKPSNDGMFQSSSPGMPESFTDSPSVSRYGLGNNREKLAEGFASWFLFGGTGLGTSPVSGSSASYNYSQDAQKFQETMANIVTPLLEKLGQRVKSAKQKEKSQSTAITEKIPTGVFIYAVAPFTEILNDYQSSSKANSEFKSEFYNSSKKYLLGNNTKSMSTRPQPKINDKTRFESDKDSLVFIDKEIKKIILLAQNEKTAIKGLLPEVLKRIQSMTEDELKAALIKASKEYIAGIDKRPRFRFNGKTENSITAESPFDNFINLGSWNSDLEKQNNSAETDSIYGLRLGIPENSEKEILPVRGYLLHVDELNKRKKATQLQIEKKKNNFEKRGINTAKIKPEFLPHSMSIGEFGAKDSLNPLPSERGEIEIVLKPEIAHRTLMTLGNSFDGARTPINLDGEDEDQKLLVSMLRNRWRDNEQNQVEENKGFSTMQRIINLLNASIGKIGFGDVTKNSSGSRHYVEAITAGGFNLDEVDEIHLSVDYVKKHITSEIKEPNLAQVTEILSRLSIKNDLIAAESIILSPKTPEEKKAAIELKKKINYVMQIKKNRELRMEFSQRISSKIRKESGPKIIFPNDDGLDYDDPKTYKNYVDGMDVDTLLNHRMANDVREILKNLGKPVATNEQVMQFRRNSNAETMVSS